MIKSELVQRIHSHNSHLYQRDLLMPCRAATEWSYEGSVHFLSRFVQLGPAATPGPAPSYQSQRRSCRSLRPEKRCESASTRTLLKLPRNAPRCRRRGGR